MVDDESQIAEIIAEFCESCGCETRILNMDENAVQAALNYRPDLITMDLMMPGMTGMELIEQLKANPQTKRIPIVVISFYAGAEEAHQALKLSQGVLSKPLKMKAFEEQIQSLLALQN